MDERDRLKELLADLLAEFHAEKVSVFGFTVEPMHELGRRIDEAGEYGAIRAWEVIQKHVDARRPGRS
jgi:hypothetical protein